MIDHHRVKGRRRRFQLQSELFLEGRENRWAAWIGYNSSQILNDAFERKIIVSREPCFVEHRTRGVTAEILSQSWKGHSRGLDPNSISSDARSLRGELCAGSAFHELRTAFVDC